MEKLSKLRWETGTVLPHHVKSVLSASEAQFFRDYSQLAGNYMKKTGLNLTEDLQPPKNLFVEVLVKEDCGEIFTETSTVVLKKHTRHHIRRVDVAHLIRQGKLEQCSSKV